MRAHAICVPNLAKIYDNLQSHAALWTKYDCNLRYVPLQEIPFNTVLWVLYFRKSFPQEQLEMLNDAILKSQVPFSSHATLQQSPGTTRCNLQQIHQPAHETTV